MSNLKSSTTGMTHKARSALLRSVIFHMTNNPFFPEPWRLDLSLAICIALADKYDTWIFAASRGDKDNIAIRELVAKEVKSLLDKLAHYVEMEAGDNLQALRSSGFPLRQGHGKSAVSHPVNPASHATANAHETVVENLPEFNKVLLHAPWGPGTISREVQATTNPFDEGAWAEKGIFVPNSRMELECAAGTNNFIRYRDVTEKGVSDWSKPVATFVT